MLCTTAMKIRYMGVGTDAIVCALTKPKITVYEGRSTTQRGCSCTAESPLYKNSQVIDKAHCCCSRPQVNLKSGEIGLKRPCSLLCFAGTQVMTSRSMQHLYGGAQRRELQVQNNLQRDTSPRTQPLHASNSATIIIACTPRRLTPCS